MCFCNPSGDEWLKREVENQWIAANLSRDMKYFVGEMFCSLENIIGNGDIDDEVDGVSGKSGRVPCPKPSHGCNQSNMRNPAIFGLRAGDCFIERSKEEE
jgi:hypothetical protein